MGANAGALFLTYGKHRLCRTKFRNKDDPIQLHFIKQDNNWIVSKIERLVGAIKRESGENQVEEGDILIALDGQSVQSLKNENSLIFEEAAAMDLVGLRKGNTQLNSKMIQIVYLNNPEQIVLEKNDCNESLVSAVVFDTLLIDFEKVMHDLVGK